MHVFAYAHTRCVYTPACLCCGVLVCVCVCVSFFISFGCNKVRFATVRDSLSLLLYFCSAFDELKYVNIEYVIQSLFSTSFELFIVGVC